MPLLPGPLSFAQRGLWRGRTCTSQYHARVWYDEYMLNYNIKGTGVPITDELRGYVEKKLAHAEKFLQSDTTAHVDVELTHQDLRHGDKFCAEFTASAAGAVYRATRWGESMHAAIDVAVDEIVAELGRDKDKRVHMMRRSATKVKEFLKGWSR